MGRSKSKSARPTDRVAPSAHQACINSLHARTTFFTLVTSFLTSHRTLFMVFFRPRVAAVLGLLVGAAVAEDLLEWQSLSGRTEQEIQQCRCNRPRRHMRHAE